MRAFTIFVGIIGGILLFFGLMHFVFAGPSRLGAGAGGTGGGSTLFGKNKPPQGLRTGGDPAPLPPEERPIRPLGQLSLASVPGPLGGTGGGGGGTDTNPPVINVVPEPSSFLLFLSGILPFLGIRLFRNNHS